MTIDVIILHSTMVKSTCNYIFDYKNDLKLHMQLQLVINISLDEKIKMISAFISSIFRGIQK